MSGVAGSAVGNVAVATERPPTARASARTESASSWTLPSGAASSPDSGSAVIALAGTLAQVGQRERARARSGFERLRLVPLRDLQRPAVLLDQHRRGGIPAVQQEHDALGAGPARERADGGTDGGESVVIHA